MNKLIKLDFLHETIDGLSWRRDDVNELALDRVAGRYVLVQGTVRIRIQSFECDEDMAGETRFQRMIVTKNHLYRC